MLRRKSSSSSAEPPACPSCGLAQAGDERFCCRCGVPLAPAGEPLEAPLSDSHARARKVDPRYVEGELVRVAGGRNQAEAELIQGLLLEEGVPSVLRRTAGFDVPDFLAAGPRDVLVPAAGAEAARELLLQSELLGPQAAGPAPRPARLVAAVLAGGGLTALVAWLLVRAAG